MTLEPKKMILVVDDDRLVLATLAHGLSQAGYEVIDADNGDDAILLAREHRPGLALLDIRMQGKSGFDVAAYLREYCHIPFMFLSAFSDAATTAQVKALGAVAYLVKPLSIGQILPVVQAAFAEIDARGTAKALVPVSAVSAGPVEPADPLVWMAVGVLMQRHSLARGPALERLCRRAAAQGLSPADHSHALLEALEQPGSPVVD